MKAKPRRIERTAKSLTEWIGSPNSILLHTVAFIIAFVAAFLHIITFDRMLLVLTTIVSLEAIYLAIFIQMTINHASDSLEEVEQDIDEIQEDFEELAEDVEDITEHDEADATRKKSQQETLESIQVNMLKLIEDVEHLKRGR